jgi:hypothetical protein
MRAATPDDAEQALDWIANKGYSRRKCSLDLECDYSSLASLLNTDPYSARAIVAGKLAAEQHLDAAEEALLAIKEESSRAIVQRQIALEQHYRKRASFADSSRYSDKVSAEVTGAGGVPLMALCINLDGSKPDDNKPS